MPGLRDSLALNYRRFLRPLLVETNAGPDFMIVGAQKSGTTFLSFLLRQQPGALHPKIKELHYFDKYYAFGDRWYRSNFVGERRGRELMAERGIRRALRYEATPEYMYHPLAARRLREFRPDLKLIVLLRDPLARAVSHYEHMRRMGIEKRPIDTAIRADCFDVSLRDDGELSFAEVHCSYVDRGVYHPQIERLARSFARDQILILFFDDLTSDPEGTLRRVCDFVGMEPSPVRELTAQNVGGKPTPVSPETAAYVRERTAVSDARLWRELDEAARW